MPSGLPTCDAPVPNTMALPAVAMPDQHGAGVVSSVTRRPVPASRTCTVSRNARPLKVRFPAIVVGANDGAPVACRVTEPVRASNTWTVGSWNGRSRGLPGAQFTIPAPSKRPKSPNAVDPYTWGPPTPPGARNPPVKPPNTTLVDQRSAPVRGSIE